MTVTVYYMTEAKLAKAGGVPAKFREQVFPSVEEAKMAPFPSGIVFGYLPVEGGCYTRRAAELDWTFEPEDGNAFIPGMRSYIR